MPNWVWLSWNSRQCLVEPSASVFNNAAKVHKVHGDLHRGLTGAWSRHAGQARRSGLLIQLDRRNVKQDGFIPGTMSLSSLCDGSDRPLPRRGWPHYWLTAVGLKGLKLLGVAPEQNLVIPWFQPVFSERWCLFISFPESANQQLHFTGSLKL